MYWISVHVLDQCTCIGSVYMYWMSVHVLDECTGIG